MSAVLVFARAPERGRVKTRLAAALGDAAALALHRAFLADALRAARLAANTVVLAHTPSAPFPEQALADVLVVQRGATFGERFDAALADARARVPTGPLVLVGADTPHLPPSAIRRALLMVTRYPSVLGPSSEGGFYLLGFRRAVVPVARAFESGNEAASVARALVAAGARPVLLEPSFDVDVPADLANLVLHLETTAAARDAWAPRETVRALAELGLAVAPRAAEGERGRGLVTARAPVGHRADG